MNEDIYEIAKKLVTASERAYNRGIQTGSGGNVSARIPGTETMLVKASGGDGGISGGHGRSGRLSDRDRRSGYAGRHA